MTIFVGSQNPVKVNAVIQSASETWPAVEVVGINVPTGVSPQPRSDEETRTGAFNRAVAALDDGLRRLSVDPEDTEAVQEILGVGLEGGVFENDSGDMWCTVWAVVTDAENNIFESNGSRFKIPEIIAHKIRQGEEMGTVTDVLAGGTNIKQNQGMIGVVTHNFIDRTEEYGTVVKVALGLWYGRNWEHELLKSTT